MDGPIINGFMPNLHMKNLERYLMKRPTCTRCQPSWWSSCLSSTASSVLQPLLEIHSSFTLWLCPGKIAKVYTKHHVQIFDIRHSAFCQSVSLFVSWGKWQKVECHMLEIRSSFTLWLCLGKIAKVHIF